MSGPREPIDDYAKAVDRRIFIDLLQKLARFKAIEDHVYVSQPGPSMEDHKLVHRELGLRKLIAFDEDIDVVKRQIFNKPVEACRCIVKSAAAFASDPTTLLDEEGFGDPLSPVIAWLRRVDHAEAGTLFREAEDLIGKLPVLSVARLTLNASLTDWAGPETGERRALPQLREAAFAELGRQIGDLLDPTLSADGLTGTGLAGALAGAFSVAAGRSIGAAGGKTFAPLSVVQYDGGTRLLSLTGIIVEQSKVRKLRTKLTRGDWPFVSSGWGDVKTVILPDLTVRERLSLEFLASEGKVAADAKLRFDIDAATEKPGFFANFAEFHRFYPVRLAAEI